MSACRIRQRAHAEAQAAIDTMNKEKKARALAEQVLLISKNISKTSSAVAVRPVVLRAPEAARQNDLSVRADWFVPPLLCTECLRWCAR
eukprot:SAG31_NODE_4803_length_2947_cov_1.853230_4_plen_88_part_01